MTHAQEMSPIDLVTASAGTGKTYRLAKEIADAVAAGTPAESIVAVTFTTRAAEELTGRARARLIEDGRRDAATALLAGRVGTVNAVFGSLLREFAIDAGRSPMTDVVPEERAQRIFRIAADEAIARHATALNRVARRFGYDERDGARPGTRSWQSTVQSICQLAQTNGIAPTALADSAARSWATLEVCLEKPRAGDTSERLDGALLDAVARALDAIGRGDGTKATTEAIAELDGARRELEKGTTAWSLWPKLTKLAAAKASNAALQPVRDAAAAHPRHPGLHEDLRSFIAGVFACAAESLQAYARYKAAHGLVDFADQEAETLRLLQRPEIRTVLRERIRRLMVDEFQDTSPIQLALFMEMSGCVERSFWVGDPKQAIYGFRGTDPSLMAAAATHVATGTGGKTDTLRETWRARQGLMTFTNDVFAPVFLQQGIDASRTIVEKTNRKVAEGQAEPLALWTLAGKNKSERTLALAAAIAGALRKSDEWLVVPKGSDEPRRLRGGDVAVLCRTNDNARAMADALESLGLRAAIERDDLLGATECATALAALRWLADSRDSVALAELAHFLDDTAPGAQPSWFEDALDGEAGRQRLEARPAASAITRLRARLPQLTPAEALDDAIAAVGLTERILRWGDATRRFAQLEALRSAARAYEEGCAHAGEPATASGLVAHLVETEPRRPASVDSDAIQVLTWHAAKGLEWPFVVLHDLDTKRDPDPFDRVAGETDGTPDWRRPLAGRWLRLWPWPYGQQSSGIPLSTQATASATGQAEAQRAKEEAVRLLYVGATRARDYLILAAPADKNSGLPKAVALDVLTDAKGGNALMPGTEGKAITLGGKSHAMPHRAFAVPEENSSAAEARPGSGSVVPAPSAPVVHPPHRLAPSSVAAAPSPADAAVIAEVIELGGRLPIIGAPDMSALGSALHAFIAADPMSAAPTAEREHLAGTILARWGVAAALPARHAVEAADRLWTFCRKRWPSASLAREVPIAGRLGLQRLNGIIDLLVHDAAPRAVIDHKSFPGTRDQWEQRAGGYAAQIGAYARIVAPKTRVDAFIHLPIAGAVLRITLPAPNSSTST